MSMTKNVLLKRIWIGALLMIVTLLVLNGGCAWLMSRGLVDHNLTQQASWAVWGMAAMLVGVFAMRDKGAAISDGILVPVLFYMLTLIVALVLGGENAGVGMWWKCGLSVVGGAMAGAITGLAKGKKRITRVGKGKRRNGGNIKRNMAK